jgi:GTPase SAR1 family protein
LKFYEKRRETFDNIEEWIGEARENSHPDVIVVLVGAKADLDS